MSNPMVKSILAVLAGVVTAFIVVALAEGAGHAIFPPPVGLDITNPEHQARIMHEIPTGAKVAVVVAWFLGALAGAWVAIRISGTAISGWVIGIIMAALSVWTTQLFPHPIWMVIAALVLPCVGVLAAKRLHAARLSRP